MLKIKFLASDTRYLENIYLPILIYNRYKYLINKKRPKFEHSQKLSWSVAKLEKLFNFAFLSVLAHRLAIKFDFLVIFA
jgi:hypothetical protein